MYCTGKASSWFFRHEMSDLFQVLQYSVPSAGVPCSREVVLTPQSSQQSKLSSIIIAEEQGRCLYPCSNPQQSLQRISSNWRFGEIRNSLFQRISSHWQFDEIRNICFEEFHHTGSLMKFSTVVAKNFITLAV